MDLDDHREAIDDASKQLSTLILACLLAALYFAIALAQLSDADYLTGLGQKLPILDATVPTKAFLLLGPVLVLVLHLGLLVQWRLYRLQVEAFIAGLSAGSRQEQLRPLYHFVLITCLVGGGHSRRIRWLAAILVALGLIVAPMLLLLWVHVRSLAFHDQALTWLLRGIALADLAAIWLFFPLPISTSRRVASRSAGAVVSLGIVLYLCIDAVVPSQNVAQLPYGWNITDHLFRLRRLDLRGAILEAKSATESKVSRLPYQAPLDLQCMDLRFADLTEATLVRPALYGSTLRGAILNEARFIDTRLDPVGTDIESERRSCVGASGPPVAPQCRGTRVDFRLAKASGADFKGQDLSRADFTGAILLGANFTGSDLSCARMEAASLDLAKLVAARLHSANLRLTSLIRADMRYATLLNADLTAADMRAAILFRNTFSGTRLHLVDLTLASVTEPDSATLEALHQVLKNAQEERPNSSPDWATVQALSAPGMDIGRYKVLFGVLARHAWLLSFDYLSVPQDTLAEPLSGRDFSFLIQAWIANEIKNHKDLKTALARRRINEELFVPLTILRDRMPHVSRPNEAPIDVVREESYDLDTLLRIQRLGDPSAVLDDRYLPFGPSVKGRVLIQAKSFGWLADFAAALTSDEVAKHKLLANKLWAAAKDNDDVALALLPRLLIDLPHTQDPQIIQWLVQRARSTRPLEAGTQVAIATLADDEVIRKEILLQAASQSAQANLMLATLESRASWGDAAASMGHIEAQYVSGSNLYTDAKASEAERTMAWQRLTRAAYRGHAGAQYLVGTLMKEEGDYAGAALWLGRAAASGAARFENGFAWFLATCPVASFRDPAKALSLSMEAVRRSKGAPNSSGPQTIETVAPEDALDTLAAAYAANGNFEGAIDTQTKALAIFRQGKDKEALASAERRLTLYTSRTPWIDH